MEKENKRETESLRTVGRGSSPWVDRWETPGVLPQAGPPLRKWSPGQLRNQITSSFLYPPPSVRECVCGC